MPFAGWPMMRSTGPNLTPATGSGLLQGMHQLAEVPRLALLQRRATD
jgi:hypothetical protein